MKCHGINRQFKEKLEMTLYQQEPSVCYTHYNKRNSNHNVIFPCIKSEIKRIFDRDLKDESSNNDNSEIKHSVLCRVSGHNILFSKWFVEYIMNCDPDHSNESFFSCLNDYIWSRDDNCLIRNSLQNLSTEITCDCISCAPVDLIARFIDHLIGYFYLFKKFAPAQNRYRLFRYYDYSLLQILYWLKCNCGEIWRDTNRQFFERIANVYIEQRYLEETNTNNMKDDDEFFILFSFMIDFFEIYESENCVNYKNRLDCQLQLVRDMSKIDHLYDRYPHHIRPRLYMFCTVQVCFENKQSTIEMARMILRKINKHFRKKYNNQLSQDLQLLKWFIVIGTRHAPTFRFDLIFDNVNINLDYKNGNYNLSNNNTTASLKFANIFDLIDYYCQTKRPKYCESIYLTITTIVTMMYHNCNDFDQEFYTKYSIYVNGCSKPLRDYLITKCDKWIETWYKFIKRYYYSRYCNDKCKTKIAIVISNVDFWEKISKKQNTERCLRFLKNIRSKQWNATE